MNRKDFLKRLGLLSTVAVATPTLLSSKDDKPQPQVTSSTPFDSSLIKVEGVERARFGNDGSVIMRDLNGNITYHVTHDGRVLVGKKQ
jgi:hypothetical protein